MSVIKYKGTKMKVWIYENPNTIKVVRNDITHIGNWDDNENITNSKGDSRLLMAVMTAWSGQTSPFELSDQQVELEGGGWWSPKKKVSKIKYKGALYIEAGAFKGTFKTTGKAWEWAQSQIKAGNVVYWDATANRTFGAYPLYAGNNAESALKLYLKLNPKGRPDDLVQITKISDLDF